MQLHSRIFALLLAALMLAGTGCPKQSRRTLVVPEVPTTGDANARARFQEARARFERDGVDASADFEAIAAEYPDDPVAAYALLYAGMSSVRAGDYAAAAANLEKLEAESAVDPAIRARGQLYLGIAYNYLGRHAEAAPLLRGSELAVQNDDERAEWSASLAVALSQGGDPLQALPYFDGWYQLASASEKAYVISALTEAVRAADSEAARRAYAGLSDKRGPVAAILGARVAEDLAAAGDLTMAEQVRAETARAREQIGMLAARTGRRQAGDPARVGALLPLTGKSRRVGALSVRGLALVAGTFDGGAASGLEGSGIPRPFDLSVRDTASRPSSAAEGVRALAEAGVIGILGPLDAEATAAAAATAAEYGVPVLSMDPIAARGEAAQSPYIFQVRHSAEDRARALARYAYDRGVRDFAILGPANGYGRAVGGAFRDEVRRLGGQIIVEASYDPKTTSFGPVIKQLRKPWQAVFVPDMADRLELVAPALATENFVSLPVEASQPRQGRKMLLLSTAEFVTPKYLRGSGRYSRGAVLAPGFYPDREDPVIGDFVDRYEQSFRQAPTAYEAYAYDAALVTRAAVEQGASTRDELVGALLRQRVRGLTGTVTFDASRRRSDDGLLFRVEQLSGGDFAIRAMR